MDFEITTDVGKVEMRDIRNVASFVAKGKTNTRAPLSKRNAIYIGFN